MHSNRHFIFHVGGLVFALLVALWGMGSMSGFEAAKIFAGFAGRAHEQILTRQVVDVFKAAPHQAVSKTVIAGLAFHKGGLKLPASVKERLTTACVYEEEPALQLALVEPPFQDGLVSGNSRTEQPLLPPPKLRS